MAYCYDGKTYETIKEMAEEYGIDRQRIYSFRRRGWSLINVNIKMYIFDHLRMYIFAILPLDRYIFLSDKIFL